MTNSSPTVATISATPKRQWLRILPQSEVFPSRFSLAQKLSWKSRSYSDNAVIISKLKSEKFIFRHSDKDSVQSESTEVDSVCYSDYATSDISEEVQITETSDHCVDDSILMFPLLRRYRYALNFSLFPVPRRMAAVECVVKCSLSPTKKIIYSFCLRVAQTNGIFEDIVVMIATMRRKKPLSSIKRRYGCTSFDIRLDGFIRTKIGDVKFNKKNAIIRAASFLEGFDSTLDMKGSISQKAKRLSNAELHEIARLAQPGKRSSSTKLVELDALCEAVPWEGVQSLTGYYGRECCWPYRLERGEKEYIHQSLFNKQSRCLDLLGSSYESRNLQTHCTSQGVNVINGKSITFSAAPISKTEFLLSFSFPMSPIQAFGLYLALQRENSCLQPEMER